MPSVFATCTRSPEPASGVGVTARGDGAEVATAARTVVAVGATTGVGCVMTGFPTRTVPVGTAKTLATGGPGVDSTRLTAMIPTASGTQVKTTGSAQLREPFESETAGGGAFVRR